MIVKSVIRYFYYKVKQGSFPYRYYLDKHKVIFIHVPKTAGTSVLNALGKQGSGGRDHLPWDFYWKSNPVKFDQYFKFSFVRSPEERLFSAYNYLLKGGNGKSDRNLVEAVSKYRCHNDFVINGLPSSRFLSLPLFLPQSYFILDKAGNVMVDFLGRFENIDEDFAVIAEKVGIKSRLPVLNAIAGDKPVWSDEARDVIRFLYGHDMDVFGY